ncbi:MAG TPA: hypothetical protein VJM32_03335 [Candidatus Saccharimonadales bacterium]|nr:hypothetical protein [Candidatus Saccharimonadales bacterium]
MSRLPSPGGDDGIWGQVLNDFLAQVHKSDGSLRSGIVADAHISAAANIAQSKVNGLEGALASKIDKTAATAKGDLFVAAGASNVQRLGVGTDGQALVADSAQAAGVKWGNPTVDTSALVSKGDVEINARDYGALGDGKRVNSVVAASGSSTVTTSAGTFSSADVGKIAIVYTSGSAGTITTIQSVQSATQVTLASTAGITTNSGNGVMVYGSDNTAALQNAVNAAATGLQFIAGYMTNPNQPMGMGNGVVTLPAGPTQAIYIVTSQVSIPSGVIFDGLGIIVNALADRFAPCVVVQPYAVVRRILVECLHGAGIQAGITSNQQAHIYLGDVRLWHVGTAIESTGLLRGQDGLALLGYHFEIGGVFIKGGYRGIYHNAGSDCVVNFVYAIGCKTGVHLNQSNQIHYTSLFVDSCTGVGVPFGGLVIDNACSNVYANVQAFEVIGVTTSCDPVVAIGQINSGVNKDIVLDIQANNTGGTALALANAQEVTVRMHAGNTVFGSGVNNPITVGVVYGSNVLTPIQIEANLSATVTPFTGTIIGTLRYSQGSNYVFANAMLTSNVLVKPVNNASNVLQVQNAASTTIFNVDNQSNRVGILTASPDQALTVNGGTINIRMSPPGGLSATPVGSGGTLASGTYYYQVISLDGAGGTSVAGSEVNAVVTGPSGSVNLSWTAVAGAGSYRIYRGTSPGGENVYYTATTNSFTDTGGASTAGTVPAPSASVAKVAPSGNTWFTGGNVGIGTAAPTATLSLGGGMAINRRGVADINYIAVASDYLIAYTTLTAPRVVTLPLAAAGNTNQTYIIKDQTGNAGASNITIQGTSGQTIDGAGSRTINTAWGSVQVYNNGSAWFTM